MMTSRFVLALATLTLVVAGGASTRYATAPAAVRYPEGFRRWTHVKTEIIEPASPAHALFGGIHHVYANPAALRGLETGRFAKGAMLVFDRLETVRTPTDVTEGKRLSIDVMERDSARFAAAGGWGYERFAGSTRTATLDSASRSRCAQCHMAEPGGTMVYSKMRE